MTETGLWEQAVVCGACGEGGWTPAGDVCGKRFARCARCGVVRLYDRVAEDRLHLLYAGYYPTADPSPDELRGQLRNPTFAHRRRRLEPVVAASERRVLEIGCGDGNFLAYLREHGWTVQGAEYDADTAALVRRRHGIAVTAGDVAQAPPPDTPFPVIAAYHVLEHVYHPATWLTAVRGMLRPGGILHLQVPNHASLTRRLTGAAWASVMFPQHVYFYTPRTLVRLLRSTGFAPLDVTTWDPWHGPGTLAASAVNQARRIATGRIPWTDAIGGGSTEGGVADEGSPSTRRPRVARRMLDALTVPLSRAEAAAGAGAVVDVIARAE
jgi:2-polyprenyl-3-methyl-5-hydroxy-6-metoxy-1,4-benzoquinol methylase